MEGLENGGADRWEDGENKQDGDADACRLPVIPFILTVVLHGRQSKAVVRKNKSDAHDRCNCHSDQPGVETGFNDAVEWEHIEIQHQRIPRIEEVPRGIKNGRKIDGIQRCHLV